jgi:sarcosine oxidase delta subunit
MTYALQRQDRYAAEGALAALDGKTRDDCPYADQDSTAWNFWVYGNENEQGRMLREFMREEGISAFYMTTIGTVAEMEGLAKYAKLQEDAMRRMRKERGWP